MESLICVDFLCLYAPTFMDSDFSEVYGSNRFLISFKKMAALWPSWMLTHLEL